ncbi:MAG: DUF4252 domain-containing protein [Bacteroidales bacterium]|nr:DUF4252 domain-containing protein [Bacteroidales bacterium]
MKRIFALFAALLLTVTAFAQNGKSIYQKYSEAENVSAVYISPAMFRLIGKIPNIEVDENSVNLSPLIRSLSGMYIINSENQSINASLRSDVERFIKTGSYELLMEAKNDGEVVQMYTMGTEKTVTGFVMLAVDGEEVTFISLDGQMPRDEVERVMIEAVK